MTDRYWRIVLTVALAVALLVATGATLTLATGDTTHSDSVTRYTILNAQVTLETTFSETRTEGMLIRLDTHTGQTWRYQQSLRPIQMANGKIAPLVVEGWTLIPENYIKELTQNPERQESHK
jgi:hypothetical protein